ncbi:hypothetical protein G7054_g993 [Neopestalotiopsis clavispora]|nr:hypothetical protein G7054_g993 [Neopestalotiopsis clavispora]
MTATPAADAEGEVLVDGPWTAISSIVLAVAKDVALEGVNKQAIVHHHARDDAKHVLGVVLVALAPSVVGNVGREPGAVVALVPGGGNEAARGRAWLSVPGVDG